MKRKAKELTLAKREASKGGRGSFSGGFSGGFGSQDMRSGSSGVSAASESLLPLVSESIKSSSQPPVVRYVCLWLGEREGVQCLEEQVKEWWRGVW